MDTKSLTVRELKEFLSQFPDDFKVLFANGMSLHGFNEFKISEYNRRIIFRGD